VIVGKLDVAVEALAPQHHRHLISYNMGRGGGIRTHGLFVPNDDIGINGGCRQRWLLTNMSAELQVVTSTKLARTGCKRDYCGRTADGMGSNVGRGTVGASRS